MKYIDTEKIRAEIERRLKYTHDWLRGDEKRHPKQTSVSKNYYKMKGDERTLDALLNFLDSLQQEQPMPDSTKLIELWHEDKEMLKEKDFRNDPWRLAYNAFLCGFGRGIAVNKQEHPVPTIMTNEMLMGEIEPKKKSNAIFDKCVENCDPAVMKEVSDNVDKMLLEEAAEEYSKRVSDGHNYRDLTCAFIAGAEWQYQKDRYGFAKLKAKEWMSGYDEGYAKGLNARKEEQL